MKKFIYYEMTNRDCTGANILRDEILRETDEAVFVRPLGYRADLELEIPKHPANLEHRLRCYPRPATEQQYIDWALHCAKFIRDPALENIGFALTLLAGREAKMKKALEFYADEENGDDLGKTARDVLVEIEKPDAETMVLIW